MLNGKLTPKAVLGGSSKKVWWRCRRDESHVWRTAVAKRTKVGTGCPYCARARATDEYSLAALFPLLSRDWHPILNEALSPSDVTPGSHRNVWWRCHEDASHEWEQSVRYRVKAPAYCPVCSGRRTK